MDSQDRIWLISKFNNGAQRLSSREARRAPPWLVEYFYEFHDENGDVPSTFSEGLSFVIGDDGCVLFPNG